MLLFSNFQASPFCTGSPVFSLAEPSDVIIICGEFNSGVEILSESYEPEQVFTVTKIIQHPDYKPTTVSPKLMFPLRLVLINCNLMHTKADIGADGGGPIAGNDIAVYHVIHERGFLLGEDVTVKVRLIKNHFIYI